MTATIQLVGAIALGVILLAVIVLGVISWARNRGRPRVADNSGGDSGGTGNDPTPGDWDSGSHGGY
ncbi:hypothetical protein [Paractinoplanes maris]|uniref:hypothetical protein n=1 Tax=Paractinoplanes maris TaxID=1734446 RepID=UPI0020223539|nr:hypothetical protein [Actinoplanes maris]